MRYVLHAMNLLDLMLDTQNPTKLSLEQQRDILDYTYKHLTDFNFGRPPKGSVAPWWEMSKEGMALLLEKGIEYGG